MFILHYPPPVHGPAIIGSYIKESKTINTNYECSYINLGISQSVEEIGRRGLRKLFRYLSLIREVKKQISVFCPDLIYLTPNSKGSGFYKDASIIFFAKRSGKKVIYHFHNKGVSSNQHRFFDNLLYRYVFKDAAVILLSNLLYPDIARYVPEERVHYCANGMPDLIKKGIRDQGSGTRNLEPGTLNPVTSDGTSSPPVRPILSLEPGTRNPEPGTLNLEPNILFLSHLIESKGVLILIEACRILKERNVNFHATIAGGEAELTIREVEEIIIKKDLNSFVSLTGAVNGDVKIKLMSSADIFVHPSFNDCLPLVLLEAMQYSLSVVSTFEGAIPDVVEDGVTGFLVPQKDAAGLADKLEILVKDPELRLKMGQAGRLKFEHEFTLERFEKRMVEILEEVLSRDERREVRGEI